MQADFLKTLRDRSSFHVQPVFDARTMALSSVELLLRNADGEAPVYMPHLGQHCPDLAARLDSQLLAKAAEEALPGLLACVDAVSFNCCSRFIESGQAARCLQTLSQAWPRMAEQLVLEIAVNTLPSRSAHWLDEVRHLRQRGVRLALDNLPLSALAPEDRTPDWVDLVKLDAASAQLMRHQHDDSKLATQLYNNAAALADAGVAVVFKHIEDTEQLARLRATGCGLLQGNIAGRAQPCQQFVRHRQIVMASRRSTLQALDQRPAQPAASGMAVHDD